MADRYTKRDAQQAFARLMQATGNRPATSYKDVGGWVLDYNGIYGGYVVHQMFNENGATAEPFGGKRRNARDFCDVVNFACRAIAIADAIREG